MTTNNMTKMTPEGAKPTITIDRVELSITRAAIGFEAASNQHDPAAVQAAIEAAGYNVTRAYINRFGCTIVAFRAK